MSLQDRLGRRRETSGSDGTKDALLDVDGAHVTDTVSMAASDPNALFGARFEAEVDITC